MMASGKIMSFPSLQNVWKCSIFLAYAYEICKSANITTDNFFSNKTNLV
jgi:hypothetical protein